MGPNLNMKREEKWSNNSLVRIKHHQLHIFKGLDLSGAKSDVQTVWLQLEKEQLSLPSLRGVVLI